MVYRNIFSKEEEKAVNKALKIFMISKQKYYIFKYINNPDKQHPLKLILCEALFRNIILELYSIFFDPTSKTIPSTIFKKLSRLLKQNDGMFILEWDISYQNLDNGYIETEQVQKTIKISIDSEQKDKNVINLNIKSIRDKLKQYRHNILAHKAFEDFDYHVSHIDLEKLVVESENIIYVLLSLTNPSTAYSFEIKHFINDYNLSNLFSILASNPQNTKL